VWVGLTFAWSPTTKADYVAILAGLAVLPPALAWAAGATRGIDRELVQRAAIASAAMLIVGLSVEGALDYPLNQVATPQETVGNLARNLGRGGVCALVLTFASLAAVRAQGLPSGAIAALLAGGGFVAFQFDVAANIIGWSLGLMAIGAALLLPRITVTGIFGGGGVLVLGAPLLYPLASSVGRLFAEGGQLPLSLDLRARMWDFSVARIAEKPWTGWGFQSARTFDDPIVVQGWTVTQLQIHPHAAPLQIWLETGFIGAALAAAALFAAGWSVGKAVQNDKWVAASIAGAMTVLLIVYAFSYSMWDDWLVALAGLAAAVIFASRSASTTRGRKAPETDSEFIPL
jgi:O-antigen ligase